MKASKKRKVLIAVENLSVPFDQRVWRECLALADAGYQVSVISPKGMTTDNNKREKIDGISIYRYRIYQSRGGRLSYVIEYLTALIGTAWLTTVVFFREGFDLIQICNPPDLLVLTALPFKALGKKIVFDQHDLSPEIYDMHNGGAKRSWVAKVLLLFERLTYAWSDIVIVVNEACRKIAVSRGGKAEQDVFIVRNAPAVESFGSARPDSSLKCGAKYLITYVGLMGPQEGIDILLRGVRCLAMEYKRNDFHALIMGNGTMFEAMKEYAKELGISRRISFTGHVGYDRVMQGIASADVCLCPDPKTPLNDKCSLVKVVEYMSLGRPLVAFDLEEVRISAGDAALYARPNDEKDFAEKINLLLEAPNLRYSMGKIGKERFRNFLTWEHSKQALYAAYDRAFGSKEHLRSDLRV
ncbi:MAG TPA: glycosyltransferase family 4 protein [Nitrososphaera sp.]|nr:glycosyltransferase family 4 protein [Nitrososphaera sp.]